MSNKPKPSELRELEGNPGHRPIPNVPKPQLSFPSPPDDMDDIAKAEWMRAGKELYDMGILNVLDLSLFEFYCRIYSKCKQEPTNADIRELRMYATEFGMSPSARTKIAVKDKEDESEMERLLNRHKKNNNDIRLIPN